MSNGQACDNCLFWLPEVNSRGVGVRISGQCRRYPPAMIPTDSEIDGESDSYHRYIHDTSASFPWTMENTWCGEWKQKDEEAS
jgi:hypothetical protein